MTPEACAAIKALSTCTFPVGGYVKRFVRDLASRPAEAALTERQESFLKVTTWRFRKQILLDNPDFDLTWTLDHPDVIRAIQHRRQKGK